MESSEDIIEICRKATEDITGIDVFSIAGSGNNKNQMYVDARIVFLALIYKYKRYNLNITNTLLCKKLGYSGESSISIWFSKIAEKSWKIKKEVYEFIDKADILVFAQLFNLQDKKLLLREQMDKAIVKYELYLLSELQKIDRIKKEL